MKKSLVVQHGTADVCTKKEANKMKGREALSSSGGDGAAKKRGQHKEEGMARET
jgi:hypothetical protein